MALDLGTKVEAGEMLRKVSADVARLEGPCKDEDAVSVRCRQLTEGEERRVVQYRRGARAFRQRPDGAAETVDDTDWYLYYRELCWHSMEQVRNLKSGGKEVFRRTKAGWFDGNRDAFNEAWDNLPSSVCLAITKVALSVNPDLDVNSLVRPSGLAWLRDTHPETFDAMTAWIVEETQKNLTARGEPSSETPS